MGSIKGLDVLVMNARQFNQDALVVLYRNYLPHVFRYIYYQVDDKAAAEMLTTKTFLKLLKAIPDYREDAKAFYPWLLKIAKNTVLEYLENLGQSRAPVDNGLSELFGGKGQALKRRPEAGYFDEDDIKKAIGKLADEYRQVLILKLAMGLSNAEITRVLDITEGSVKSLQVGALAILERIVGSYGYMDEHDSQRIEPSIGTGKERSSRLSRSSKKA